METRTIPGAYSLPVPAAGTGRSGRGAYGGAHGSAADSGSGAGARSFESEIVRGEQRNNLAPASDFESESDAAGAFESTVPAHPAGNSAFVASSATATPFLAQQIAQETIGAEFVPQDRYTAAAIGSYEAAPASRVSYAGPIVGLDISV